MSTTNTLPSENILMVYSINGKTMMGKFITYPSRSNIGAGGTFNPTDVDGTGVFSKLLGNNSNGEINYDNYYFVKNPAEINYTLEMTAAGTAKLKWNIVPLVYGVIKQDVSKDVVIAYEKSSVSLSDATADTLHSDVVNAYNEVV